MDVKKVAVGDVNAVNNDTSCTEYCQCSLENSDCENVMWPVIINVVWNRKYELAMTSSVQSRSNINGQTAKFARK